MRHVEYIFQENIAVAYMYGPGHGGIEYGALRIIADGSGAESYVIDSNTGEVGACGHINGDSAVGVIYVAVITANCYGFDAAVAVEVEAACGVVVGARCHNAAEKGGQQNVDV